MALLRLMVLGPCFVVCLLILRMRDLMLPALAGMGRTKTYWSVLPIVRVCGVNHVLTRQHILIDGVSLRGRGQPWRRD